MQKKTIDNWRKNGVLTSFSGIPAVRFSLQHITELERTKLEKLSLIERKNLEIENESFFIQFIVLAIIMQSVKIKL